ncbi:flagellar motor protein MotB [Metabacillus arenae]|uniref:Flagellar motor protein MotB n=1 Tax=Metabacillus arenae TaxID=2771434 RepID=A0A926NLT6_9BACI|nr:flagellar motor protein MotB [Metabacillus arenae]MBD1380382.1 flagellar motor protein MotB [Metabacillus arenae]
MARRRKKKAEQDHIDESWLIPYADILTLLLALFIVLFAMSSVDAQKFQMLSRAFNSVFTGGTGVMEYSSPVDEIPIEQPTQKSKDLDKLRQLEKEKLKEVQEKINSYIQENKLQASLKTNLTDEGLLITIVDNIFFDSGSATIRSEDQSLAKEISELLIMNPPRNIIISGHTDNVPIQNSQFESNWHLSVMRAISFMKLLIENKQLNPKLFSAKGLGEYSPFASNDTPQGREKNRRVEILILPNEVD